MPSGFEYSERYYDEEFEYRHVIIPKAMGEKLRCRVMKEQEWRALGICQSAGWMHYDIHRPEPHILLFKRPRGYSDLSESERRKWDGRVNLLIQTKNEALIRKCNQAKKRSVLKETTINHNVPGGSMSAASPEAHDPLAAVNHLFY